MSFICLQTEGKKFVEKFGDKFAESWEKPLEMIFHDRYVTELRRENEQGKR